jgi:hypothetical protein
VIAQGVADPHAELGVGHFDVEPVGGQLDEEVLRLDAAALWWVRRPDR